MAALGGVDVVAGILGVGLGVCAGPFLARIAGGYTGVGAGTRAGDHHPETGVGHAGPVPPDARPGAATAGAAGAAGAAAAVTTTAGAAAFGVIGARVGIQPVLPVYLYLAAVGVVLWVVDIRTRRLPDALTLPSYAVAGLGLGIAAAVGGSLIALARAATAAAVVFGLYAVVCVLSRGSALGFGDVKLAGLLALSLGWAGWDRVVFAAVVAHVLAALFLIFLMVTGGRWRGRTVPFGPYLLTGWAVAVVVSPPTT